jgi:hypothetical protein
VMARCSIRAKSSAVGANRPPGSVFDLAPTSPNE